MLSETELGVNISLVQKHKLLDSHFAPKISKTKRTMVELLPSLIHRVFPGVNCIAVLILIFLISILWEEEYCIYVLVFFRCMLYIKWSYHMRKKEINIPALMISRLTVDYKARVTV